MTEGSRVYLYGVMAADAAPAPGETGIGGAPVHGVRCGDFTALVSRIPPEAVDFAADAVLAHERVLTDAMRLGTVLPAAYGHLFTSEAELCTRLEGAAAEMRANLEHLGGHVEAGLTVSWRKEAFLPDIETAELAALMKQARQGGVNQSPALAVGELVENLVSTRRQDYVAAICPRLAEAAVEMRLNEPMAIRMVLNAAFLVRADAYGGFVQTVEQVARPYADRLNFHCSGPWPPHNFSCLRIGR